MNSLVAEEKTLHIRDDSNRELRHIILYFLTGRSLHHCYPNTYWSLLPAVSIVINLHSAATYFLSLVGLLTGSHPQINPRLLCCSIHQALTENSSFFSMSFSPHLLLCVTLGPAFLFNLCWILPHSLAFCFVSHPLISEWSSLSSFFCLSYFTTSILVSPHLLFSFSQ